MSNQENVSRKAWLTGFVLNLCGNPLPIAGSEKEAAYLYNGVGLPEIDPVSMTLGWLIGCRIGAQRNTEVTPDEPVGDPVAYLYNGVRLPDINQVWTNKETYPYAYLIDYPSEWCLTLMSATLTFNGKQYVSGSASYVSYQLDSAGTSWVFRKSGTSSGVGYSTCLWASQDLLYKDGTVCLAASEPVAADPLYNGVRLPDINPSWTAWGKTAYPYAYLIDYPSEWCLYLTNATLTFNGTQYVSGSASYVSYQLDSAGTAWVYRKRGSTSGAGYSTCLWASQDLLNTDGTVCLAASEPVVTAYLYNGVQLPDINEVWTDTAAYPYGYLVGDPDEWSLVFMSTGLSFDGTRYVSGSASYVRYKLDSAGTAWIYDGQGTTGGAAYPKCLWASKDLLYAGGTVCLAASEPVPVYE